MFKTIYSKYLSSFILLLTFGFCSITVIICAVVNNYSLDSKSEIMNKTARMVYVEISSDMRSENCSFSQAIERNRAKDKDLYRLLSDFSESNILLIDVDGTLLFENTEKGLIKEKTINSEGMSEIVNHSGNSRYSNFNGLFEEKRFNFIYSIEETVNGNNKPIGYIVLTSADMGMRVVYDRIIKLVILLSLWVFFAAIIIVYFVTNRITTPIKEINKAVKEYSRGNFDVRIPVKGEDEIAILSEAFNNMAFSLQKMENSKNTFFSSVSHDLKTPMTSIRGFIEGILDGTIPEEKKSYYLTIVLEEVKRLTRLVNSLLDITRMQSGSVKLNKESFDVCEMARLIIISFEEKINEKKLNVEFNCTSEKSFVFADKDAIHQVMYNIISNAMKFTDDDGTLKIDIEKQNDKTSVSIYNTGIGIKEEELPYVFDCFYKADSSRGLDKTGTGLGMFIAKSKIEAHGEKIRVESEYGKYCRFVFTLKTDENQKKQSDKQQGEE